MTKISVYQENIDIILGLSIMPVVTVIVIIAGIYVPNLNSPQYDIYTIIECVLLLFAWFISFITLLYTALKYGIEVPKDEVK